MSDLDLDATAIESLYARGVTDGLPVVPPTRALVERAVAATERAADDLVAVVPPNYGRAAAPDSAAHARGSASAGRQGVRRDPEADHCVRR